MKKRRRGWPSSANRNAGLANDVKSCNSRVAELTVKSLKYGAEFDSAMISAGYIEFNAPDVVATMKYIAYVHISTSLTVSCF